MLICFSFMQSAYWTCCFVLSFSGFSSQFHMFLTLYLLWIYLTCFLYFTLSYFFPSINHLLCHCAWFLILYHLTWMRFSRSTHLLICLYLEILMPIIRTGLSILVGLIDLVNSAIFFLSQTTLLRCLILLQGSQTLILTVLVFWISFSRH